MSSDHNLLIFRFQLHCKEIAPTQKSSKPIWNKEHLTRPNRKPYIRDRIKIESMQAIYRRITLKPRTEKFSYTK